jgi:transcriptional regulator with XRE-family HTH domain
MTGMGNDRKFTDIGERLALTREVFGLSQREFCGRAGISPNTYNQWEKGVKRPDVDGALALRDAYQITLDWIYSGDPSGLRYDTAAAIDALRTARRGYPSHPRASMKKERTRNE